MENKDVVALTKNLFNNVHCTSYQMSLSNIELFLFSATNIVRAKASDMTRVKWSYWKDFLLVLPK